LSALADTTKPGDVVRLEGAITTYARVIERVPSGLRVSWHGVDYLASGRRSGVTNGDTAIWTLDRFDAWEEPEPEAAPATPRTRRRKGRPA